MQRDKSNYIDDVFVVNRWMLKCAGLWSPDNQNRYLQFTYKIYVVLVVVFVNLYFTATEFFSLFETYKDLNSFIKNINFFLTHFMGAVKCLFWYVNRSTLRTLMSQLEYGEFHYGNLRDEYGFTAIYAKYKRIGIKYSLFFLLLAHMTLSSSYVPPMVAAIGSYRRNETLFERPLPYFSWMPFRFNTPGWYLFAIAYQAGPMFSYAYSIVGMDSLFMSIMNTITAHFLILQLAFKHVKKDADHDSNASKSVEILTQKINLRNAHLQQILGIAQSVEDVYKFLNLGQAMATLFILCTCLYLVSTAPFGGKQFFAEIVYMVAMGYQLYLYCSFGNELTLEAQGIPNYIWESDWLDIQSLDLRKNLIYTIHRMQKPLFITMGKFSPLTLQTFMSILKASYSFFAVIRNSSDM